MTGLDPEEILWTLSATDRDAPDAAVPSDETLLAYRAGQLEDSEAQRVETLLGHNIEARERLIELAMVDLAVPSAALRERLVPSPKRPWWAASAAVAAACLVALGLYLAQPRALREVPAFDVSVEMLATVRSSAGTEPGTLPATTHQAFAETPVRIVLEPTEHGVAGVEFGLYIRRDQVLERLVPGAGLQLETHRGSAVFEATAARLLGTTPGAYELFVVAANRLPSSIDVDPGAEALASLANATGGRIYHQAITLLPGPQ